MAGEGVPDDGVREQGVLFERTPANTNLSLDVARRLPPRLRFGPSSWTYPGWKGLVYHRDYTGERDFRSRCLEELGRFPWFRIIGIDHTFYSPARASTLDRYAKQLPADFLWLSKVWERVTTPRFGPHPRYGALAGQDNPNFLDSQLFYEAVLPAYDRPLIRDRTGPFLLQFQSLGRADAEWLGSFLTRLRSFLLALPKAFRYAVEVRTPELIQPRYFEILNEAGATHCFNHWDRMPPLIDQMRVAAQAGGLEADFYVARLLTPRGMGYAEAVAQFSPFDKLVQEQASMRDDVVRLAMRALKRDADAFVLVNNRIEGNSPTTIDAIGRMIVDGLEGSKAR
ncbi:MAG TPA: hypothetical protein DIU15_16855 [Deltaproteobacteria bacterium]|nr:hypothetical protein [Deltaproteobacteria bacterium]HCP47714.1 hypothetical protein [Deltaproteobacteria bacterium]